MTAVLHVLIDAAPHTLWSRIRCDTSTVDVTPKFAINQSRPEEITIKEDVGHINFITDDGFGMYPLSATGAVLHQCYMLTVDTLTLSLSFSGDIGFDERELMREASTIEDSLFQTPAPIGDASTIAAADETSKMDVTLTDQERMVENDGFGDDGLGTLI